MTHGLARTLHDVPVIRASFWITNECAGRQPSVTDFHQTWITEVLRLLGQARWAGALQGRETGNGPEALLSAAVCGIGVLAGTGMPYPQLSDRVAALWKPPLSALVPRATSRTIAPTRRSPPGAPTRRSLPVVGTPGRRSPPGVRPGNARPDNAPTAYGDTARSYDVVAGQRSLLGTRPWPHSSARAAIVPIRTHLRYFPRRPAGTDTLEPIHAP
ncbi:hypothetical protein ACF1BU_37145 [Streptomyces sp. NPDC014724]|uniref:hypothetical protein n=1 Tax=unclassified Streptomyces TaxID=2593676 RepID=UPI0036F77356